MAELGREPAPKGHVPTVYAYPDEYRELNLVMHPGDLLFYPGPVYDPPFVLEWTGNEWLRWD